MSFFQNMHIFEAFYLTLVALPFLIAAAHSVLEGVDRIRSAAKRASAARVPVSAPVHAPVLELSASTI